MSSSIICHIYQTEQRQSLKTINKIEFSKKQTFYEDEILNKSSYFRVKRKRIKFQLYTEPDLDQTWPGPLLTWAWQQDPFQALFEVPSEVPLQVYLQVYLKIPTPAPL